VLVSSLKKIISSDHVMLVVSLAKFSQWSFVTRKKEEFVLSQDICQKDSTKNEQENNGKISFFFQK